MSGDTSGFRVDMNIGTPALPQWVHLGSVATLSIPRRAQARHASVSAACDSLILRSLAEEHAPGPDGECCACSLEVIGREYEMDAWPCDTFALIELWTQHLAAHKGDQVAAEVAWALGDRPTGDTK